LKKPQSTSISSFTKKKKATNTNEALTNVNNINNNHDRSVTNDKINERKDNINHRVAEVSVAKIAEIEVSLYKHSNNKQQHDRNSNNNNCFPSLSPPYYTPLETELVTTASVSTETHTNSDNAAVAADKCFVDGTIPNTSVNGDIDVGDNGDADSASGGLLCIHSQLREMGHALKCPLCQHTLSKPTLLPCIHAFCHDCISSYIANSRFQNSGTSKRPKCNCPICKIPITKRSLQHSSHLENLVRGYKLSVKAFGLAPIVYDGDFMDMTQIANQSSMSLSQCAEEDDNNEKKKDTDQPSVVECHEHMLVTRTFHRLKQTAAAQQQHDEDQKVAAVAHNAPQTSPRYTRTRSRKRFATAITAAISDKKSFVESTAVAAAARIKDQERIHKLREVEQQERILKVDERALVQAAVRKQAAIAKKKKDTLIMEFADNNKEEKRLILSSSSESIMSCDQEEVQDFTNMVTSLSQVSAIQAETREEAAAHQNSLEWIQEEEEDTKENDDILKKVSVNHEHDGKKISNKTEQNDNQEVSSERTKYENKSVKTKTKFAKNDKTNPNILTPPTIRSTISSTAQNSSTTTPTTTVVTPSKYVVGTIVNIASRTWPGVNKPGGVALITAITHRTPNSNDVTFDVKYVLGGRERGVSASFISLVEEEELGNYGDEATSPGEKELIRKASPRKRRKRVVFSPALPLTNPLNKIKNEIQEIMASRHDKKRAMPSATIQRNKRNKILKITNSKQKNKKASPPTPKKSLNSRSKQNCEPSTPDTVLQDDSDDEGDGTIDRQYKKENLIEHEMQQWNSLQDIYKLSEERYASLIGNCLNNGVLNVVLSSVNDIVKDMVHALSIIMKSQGVTIKIQSDFHPQKTHICITTPSTNQQAKRSCDATKHNKTSQCRTLKTMRASLAGIPIVTPDWVTACVDQRAILIPGGSSYYNDDEMESRFCIRSLPTTIMELMEYPASLMTSNGTRDEMKDEIGTWGSVGGVSRMAALKHNNNTTAMTTPTKKMKKKKGINNGVTNACLSSSSYLFAKTAVYLCGSSWNKVSKSNALKLLEDGGATVLSSTSAVVKTFQAMKGEIPKGGSRKRKQIGSSGVNKIDDSGIHTVVFLCEDTKNNSASEKSRIVPMITGKLLREVDELLPPLEPTVSKRKQQPQREVLPSSSTRLYTVGSAWLYDCISCGACLNAAAVKQYPPSLSCLQAKQLWERSLLY